MSYEFLFFLFCVNAVDKKRINYLKYITGNQNFKNI